MKRILAHEFVTRKTTFRDINKFVKKEYEDIFNAAEYILKIGEEKWN